MPTSISCPSCRSRLHGPDGIVGQTVKCPKCKTSFTVSGEPDYQRKAEPAASSPTPTLIPCEACGQAMATTAFTCPKCGGPNRWIHPEIKRFLDNQHLFTNRPPFQYSYGGTVLTGQSEIKTGTVNAGNAGIAILTTAGVLMLLWLLIPGPVAALFLYGGMVAFAVGSIIMTVATPQPESIGVSFSIDFVEDPPRWQSDNEQFWQDVKAFFIKPS